MKLRYPAAVLGVLLATVANLPAQFVWTGANSGDPLDAGNWTPPPSPVSQLGNANLTFGNATNTSLLFDASAINIAFDTGNGTILVHDISFTSSTANYSFSGTGSPTLAIGGNVSLTTANPNPVILNNSLKVDLAGGTSQTIDVVSGAGLGVLSDISGTGSSLVKTGAGTLTLGGINTYDGTVSGPNTIGTVIRAGQLTVTGGSITHASAQFIVGNLTGDNGTVSIEGGGDVTDSIGYLGASASSTGTGTVKDAGSTWTNTNYLYVGTQGTGTLNISNGGAVISDNTSVANNVGSSGTISVDGSGSTLTNANTLYVGSAGTGFLNVTNGADVVDNSGVLGNNSGGSGIATINGAGSTWANTNQLIVGNTSPGTLIVINGGSASSAIGTVSGNTAATSTARITGTNSVWSNSTSLRVGFSGIGNLTVDSGGTVSVQSGAGTLTLGSNATGNGTLNIGGLASGAAAAPGFVRASVITTGSGTGTVQFKTTSTPTSAYYFTQDGTSAGAFISVTGTTKIINTGGYNILPTANSYSGGTTINGGTLVAGSSGAFGSGSITVSGGSLGALNGVTINNPISLGSGRLTGAGTFNSSILVGPGVVLAPGFSPGTLTFGSGLTLGGGGALDFEVQSATSLSPGTGYDFLSVNGASLDITATTSTPFKINLLSLNISGLTGDVSDFDSSQSYSWRFATGFSGLAGFTSANQFLIDTTGFTNNLNGGTFSVSLGTYTGNPSLFLNFTPVPEPSTYALLAAGLASLLLPVLRRRQRN